MHTHKFAPTTQDVYFVSPGRMFSVSPSCLAVSFSHTHIHLILSILQIYLPLIIKIRKCIFHVAGFLSKTKEEWSLQHQHTQAKGKVPKPTGNSYLNWMNVLERSLYEFNIHSMNLFYTRTNGAVKNRSCMLIEFFFVFVCKSLCFSPQMRLYATGIY